MKMEEAVHIPKLWDWKIAAHLFLVGVGAGTYLVGFILTLTRPELILLSKVTVSIAAPLVIVGTIFLILQLGQKANAFRAFSRPVSSWMARGAIILTVFVILGLIHIGTWIWPSTVLGDAPGLRLTLGSVASVFAVFVLIYTGMLLRALKPIAFWNTLTLPLLFLVSGISTGIMGAALVLAVYGFSTGLTVERPLVLLARYEAFIIIVEALILGFYLWRMRRVIAARDSVRIVTKGNLAAGFWVGVVAAGLVVPLAFAVYHIYLSAVDPLAVVILTIVASIIGLVGGFMLRYIVVAGGTSAEINVEGVLVPLPETSRATVSRRVAF